MFYFIYSLIRFSVESFKFFYFNQFLDTIPGLIFHILMTMAYRYIKICFKNLFLFNEPDYWGRNSIKFKFFLVLAICKYSQFVYKNFQTKYFKLLSSKIFSNSFKLLGSLRNFLFFIYQNYSKKIINTTASITFTTLKVLKFNNLNLIKIIPNSSFFENYSQFLGIFKSLINDFKIFNLNKQFKQEFDNFYQKGHIILKICRLEIIRLFYLFITIHHFKQTFSLSYQTF